MKNFFSFLALLLLWACNSDSLETDSGRNSGSGVSHELIELGDQLEDPYTVENITKALVSLYPTKADVVSVETTDYYVRFLPKSQEEFEVLEDLGLFLMDHPVDYSIKKEGDWYHDPEISSDEITWQYAVVGKDFAFPSGIKYEILDNCYISEHAAGTKAIDGIDWSAVERESFRLTGNEDLLGSGTRGSESFQPKGRITIMDKDYDSEPIGVKGVKVSCNVFVKFANAFTDDEGYYKFTTSFSADPRYRLVFQNKKGFAIGMNLILVPASFSTLGKGSPQGCDALIDENSEGKLFSRCVVNNAGYDYYESCSQNGEKIKTPPANFRLWLMQSSNISLPAMLRQGALLEGSKLSELIGSIYTAVLKQFLPDIILGLKNKKDYQSIYAAAIHQFAHGSHLSQVGTAYWTKLAKFDILSFLTSGGIQYGVGTESDHGYCEIGEMWAYYVQTVLYRERYKDSAESFGTEFWFAPQLCLYLDERGLNRFKLFKAFTSDITDRDALQAKLLALYPESKSIINQAFIRYD